MRVCRICVLPSWPRSVMGHSPEGVSLGVLPPYDGPPDYSGVLESATAENWDDFAWDASASVTQYYHRGDYTWIPVPHCVSVKPLKRCGGSSRIPGGIARQKGPLRMVNRGLTNGPATGFGQNGVSYSRACTVAPGRSWTLLDAYSVSWGVLRLYATVGLHHVVSEDTW